MTIAVLMCCYTRAQTPPSSAGNLSTYVNHLMDTHVGVERMIPPGWSITAKGVSAGRGPDGKQVVQFHIFVKGGPAGALFEQKVLPVGEETPTSVMQGISAGKDGILMCAGRVGLQCGDPNNPDDPIEFTVSPEKGEPFRFLFESGGGTIGIVVVPDPVSDRNKGCTLSAVRLTPGFILALITGTGFPPNVDIHYTTPGSTGDQVIRSNDIGVIRFSLLPHPDHPGQTSGTMKLKVTEIQCSPVISYDWSKL
jgi:hypothetical protein